MNAKIMRIVRYRMGTDGGGVSTLVAFWGCPLYCRYCINDFCHDPKIPYREMEPEELARKLIVDEIYYRMSGGGIVFGGGEPLLNAEYIKAVVELIPKDIPIRVETSLNVSWKLSYYVVWLMTGCRRLFRHILSTGLSLSAGRNENSSERDCPGSA